MLGRSRSILGTPGRSTDEAINHTISSASDKKVVASYFIIIIMFVRVVAAGEDKGFPL